MTVHAFSLSRIPPPINHCRIVARLGVTSTQVYNDLLEVRRMHCAAEKAGAV